MKFHDKCDHLDPKLQDYKVGFLNPFKIIAIFARAQSLLSANNALSENQGSHLLEKPLARA